MFLSREIDISCVKVIKNKKYKFATKISNLQRKVQIWNEKYKSAMKSKNLQWKVQTCTKKYKSAMKSTNLQWKVQTCNEQYKTAIKSTNLNIWSLWSIVKGPTKHQVHRWICFNWKIKNKTLKKVIFRPPCLNFLIKHACSLHHEDD